MVAQIIYLISRINPNRCKITQKLSTQTRIVFSPDKLYKRTARRQKIFESNSCIYARNSQIYSSRNVCALKGQDEHYIVVNNQKYISGRWIAAWWTEYRVQRSRGPGFPWQRLPALANREMFPLSYLPRPFTTSPVPLHPLLPLILFDRGFPIFFF